MPFLRPVGAVSLNAYPCLRRNFGSRCLQRSRSSRASSGARQVARRLAPVVGHPHLHDVAHRQHAGQELRVVSVVLPPPVGAGLDHLGHRADDAVDAQRREPLLQVEPGRARLVDALRGRVEGSRPLCDLGGVVAEGGRSDLAGHRVEGDGLYGSRVHVEADEGGSIQHERAPFHACGVAATGSNQTLAIVGLIHGDCMQQGLSMLLCPAHIVSFSAWGGRQEKSPYYFDSFRMMPRVLRQRTASASVKDEAARAKSRRVAERSPVFGI